MRPDDRSKPVRRPPLPHDVTHQLRRGPVLLAEGGLIVVKSGAILRCRVLGDGRRQVTALYTAGQPVNLRELLGAVEPNAAHFVALEGTTYGRLSAAELGNLDRYLANELAVSEQLILSLGLRSASERLAYLFCQLAWQHQGGSAPTGVLPFIITQDLVASILGLSTVHVNRVVQQFRQQRLADLTREGIVIHDFRALSRLAEFEPTHLELGERTLPPVN